MADIRNFLREKEKREKNRTDYRQKIWKHKLTSVYRIALVLVICVALIVLLMIQYRRHIYTGYDVISSIPRETHSGAVDVALQNMILTYSHDGAHCTDSRGNVIWNQTYEIQDIKLAINQNVAAIGNYNGREIYLQNTEGILGTINTAMPIRNLAVSANGYVAAVLADTDITWIHTYKPSGELNAYAPTRMNDSGYPGALSLSPSGDMLAVAYVYVDVGVLKTDVAFYNFRAVGDNVSDYIVSAYTLTDQLVPEIGFLDEGTIYVVGDSQLRLYKGSQIPEEKAVYLFEQEILSVYANGGYVGLVFASDGAEDRYRMDVYSASTEKVGSFYFDVNYTDIIFTEDNFIIYNEVQCMICTYDGLEKFNGVFSETVNLMIPTKSAYRYLLVTNDSIDTIQLK